MMIVLIVATGLMAGIYFAFSAFVMKALNQLPAADAGRTMNKINDVILNTLFLPIFFGSTLWYAGLIIWTLADWSEGRSYLIIASSIVYLVGMFGVTAFGNVPLNNRLKASGASDIDLSNTWENYLVPWLRLNHIRVFSCILSCTLLILATI